MRDLKLEHYLGIQDKVAVAERVLARTGSAAGIVSVPYDEAYEVGFEDMLRRVPSIQKVKDAIGWEPTIRLDETLDEVIGHFKA